MKTQIKRRSEDNLSQQVWQFDISLNRGSLAVILVWYGTMRRSTPRGTFRSAEKQELWDRFDERRHHSGLPRPTDIPQDVLDELRELIRSLSLHVYVGWYNADFLLKEVK